MLLRGPIRARPRPRTIAVRPRPGNPLQALVQFGPLVVPAALGRGGISAFKREGDGATPRAAMTVLAGFKKGGQRRAIASPLGLKPVGQRDGWCDSPAHPAYNRPVRLPFPASHEKLVRNDDLYDVVLVLDWNLTRRVRGLGSAIFVHIARDGYQPTEGCVALKRRDAMRLVKLIRRGDVVRVL